MIKKSILAISILLLLGCRSKDASSVPTMSENSPTINTSSTENTSYFKRFINAHECDQIIDKTFYTICYDYGFKGAKAVGYTLSGDLVNELNIEKRLSFKVERQINSNYRAATTDYTGSGYDRAHLASDAAFDWSMQSLDSVYSLANITPQARKVNRYTWIKAERLERFIAVQLGTLNVINVVKYSSSPKHIGPNKIAVPTGYYKILFNHEKNYKKCLYYANDNNIITGEDRLKNHEVSCISI